MTSFSHSSLSQGPEVILTMRILIDALETIDSNGEELTASSLITAIQAGFPDPNNGTILTDGESDVDDYDFAVAAHSPSTFTAPVPSAFASTAPAASVPATIAPANVTVAAPFVAPATVTVAPATIAPATIAPTTIAPTTIAPTSVAPAIVTPATITPAPIIAPVAPAVATAATALASAGPSTSHASGSAPTAIATGPIGHLRSRGISYYITPELSAGRYFTITQGFQVGVFAGWHNTSRHVVGATGACFIRYSIRDQAVSAFFEALNSGNVTVV